MDRVGIIGIVLESVSYGSLIQLSVVLLVVSIEEMEYTSDVPAKKNMNRLLEGNALVKEVNRRVRLARVHWDAHRNKACRRERDTAMKLYETLSQEQREKVPQVLRVWLRYRSEKYFGENRTKPGGRD